jgi:hypothetical protein
VADAVLISKEQAIKALRAHAWTEQVESCGHNGCTDHLAEDKKRIHCMLSFTGADWDLTEAEALIGEATEVGWADNLFGHCLAALKDGRVYRFDVPRLPADKAESGQTKGDNSVG